ncbi:MAG: haloacid dehalogenase [Desulfobacteraceae bacterium]|nr:haloacid dehalogenase [Desulfobacteraceae bacterium]
MIPLSRPISPSEIAFDIDGVVADTMEAFLGVARNEFGIDHLRKDHITSYWLEDCLPIPAGTVKAIIGRLVDDPLGTSLRPICGAVEALLSLASRFPVTFVTARPDDMPITMWLHSILPEIPHDRLTVIATGGHALKAEVLKGLGAAYFVEDHLETCEALCEQGIGAIVFDQPWNRGRTPYVRVNSWPEIIGMMDLS